MSAYNYDGYPHAPHVPDPYAATYGAYGAPPAGGGFHAAPAYPDEVRTIFITGFPADVKERELNNLLRFLPGYEASQMNYKHGQAQGFALFATGALARAAIDNIQHLCFDGESCVLRCEMAHKNMYLKDAEPSAKRTKYGSAPGAFGAFGESEAPPGGALAPSRPAGYAPISNTKDNPPCNTLFIGNLGDAVSETELKGIFSTQGGFKQIKLVKGAKNVTCFVEFEDVTSAMHVHSTLQGAILTSSDRGGIRIQYSKNPFGRKRDAAGNEVMPAQ